MKNAGFRALFKPKRTGGNIHFGKVVLILMLISVMVLGGIEKVSATNLQYYYDKYNSVTNPRTYYVSKWSSPNQGANMGTFQIWPSYVITNGTPSGVSGAAGTLSSRSSGYRFLADVNIILEYTNIRYRSSDGWYDYTYRMSEEYKANPVYYSRGALIQSDIIAEDGTYPVNGRHTDGYWYVRRGLVNNNPTITLSNPSENSYFSKKNMI